MNFPINETINTELFITNRTAALYNGEIWLRIATNEDDQRVATS